MVSLTSFTTTAVPHFVIVRRHTTEKASQRQFFNTRLTSFLPPGATASIVMRSWPLRRLSL